MATSRVFFDKVVFFPIQEIYQKLWEKYDFYKKKLDLQTKTVPFFFFSNAEKMEFYITVR